MDTFQTPPTQQKCLLFYWPLIFLSGTFYVLVLLIATFSPLYNLSTPCMHSSILGCTNELNNWHITSGSVMLRSLHLWHNANSAFFPAVVSLSMATAMSLVLCNFKPKCLNDWTHSMVVPLYVNFGAALRHFSNTTTLVLLTLMTNCRWTQNSDRASICFCNLCGVSDINAKSSTYNSNLTTMSVSCGGLSPSSASRCFSSPSR